VLAALFLALPLLTDGLSRKFDFDEHRRLVASWRPDVYPSVDVFLPVCGEPVEVLRNTWKYVVAMSEHYPETVTPYVLDDSHSPELKQMAREFGFACATRPNRGWFKKSGNLWFGFQVSYGDYILLLDTDFAPRHDLLDETLPYMDAYPDTGIVQTPQYFRITGQLHLHGPVYVPGAGADHRDPRLRAERAAAEEHDLHGAGGAALGGDHPALASCAVPARGVGGPGHRRVGAPVRVLGRGQGKAAGLEAVRRGQEEAGRPAPVLGLLHHLDRGQLAGMDRPGVLTHDHHGALQLHRPVRPGFV
jgi:hypothetical protein